MQKFNVILVSAILITLALTWFAFPMTVQAATTTFQLDNTDGTGADNYLQQEQPTSNNGGYAWGLTVMSDNGANNRAILKFDISSIPASSTITSATLKLKTDYVFQAEGRTHWAYRLKETNWVEGTGSNVPQAGSSCWDYRVYATTAWLGGAGGGAPDGTYTTTYGASATVLATGNWMEWTVTDQVQYAIDNTIDAHFLIRDGAEDGSYHLAIYKGENYEVDAPKLEVTYVLTPTISSFIPTSGGTGTSVTITGTNFTGATAVKFGGTDASGFTVDTPTQITATVGSGTTGTVSVTTSYGTATSTGSFTYIPPGASFVTLQLDNTDDTGADTYMGQTGADNNEGGKSFFNVQTDDSNNSRAILKFKLTGIPAGSTISSATLKLKASDVHDAAGRTYWAYRLTETDWVEGTEFNNFPQTGSSCWNKKIYNTTAWAGGGGGGAADGGTYTATGGASATVPSSADWMNWTVTTQVQYAVTGGIDAHFLIKDGTENDTYSFVTYDSESKGANAPTLEVTYTAPAALTVSGSDVSSNMSPNTTNNEMLSIQLVASEETITVTGMTFNFSGSAVSGDFPSSGIKLWDDLGTVGIYDFGTDTQAGTPQNFAAEVTFSSMSYAVTTTTRNLLLTVDIAVGAEPSHTLAATLLDNTKINVTGGTVNSFAAISTAARTLPVELSSFTAQFLNSIPTLYWQTQSETDNMGWFVYRNEENDFTTSERISEFIDGHGTTTQQQSYIYEDTLENPEVGDTYYYWLESIDYSGMVNHYDKVAMLTIPDIHNPDPHVAVPRKYGLQTGPNPFNSSLTVSYMLPQTDMVRVEIYNMYGQLVTEFNEGLKTADKKHEIDWNGKDLYGQNVSSGVLLIKLITSEGSETKKAILLR